MKDKYKGIVCIVTASFFFAIMGVFVRLAGDLPVFQKSFFRNLVSLLFAYLMIRKEPLNKKLNGGDIWVLFLRSFFGAVGVVCNFYAVDHMLLADASILNKLSPFFALIMSAIVLKETLKPFQVVAVTIAFMGALLVIKPGAGIIALPALIGFCSGACAGTSHTMIRLLSKRGVKGPFIVFFFSGFSVLTMGPLMLMDYVPMTLKQVGLLLLAGLTAAFGQFALTAAFCHAPSREISIFDYSQIIFSAILGFFIFGQVPDKWSFMGYGIILVTAAANFFYNNKLEKEREEKKEN